jgi:two-component system, OmpR family, sensor histidine kinase VicK
LATEGEDINRNSLDEIADASSHIILDKKLILARLLHELYKAKKDKIDFCIRISKNDPCISLIVEIIIKAIKEIKKNRKIITRCIISGAEDVDIDIYKKLVSLIDEVKFSNKIKDIFVISDLTFISFFSIIQKTPARRQQRQQQPKLIPQSIIIKSKSFVEQQQQFFDLLWNSVLSTDHQINEVVKEGKNTEQLIKTKVLENQQEILKALQDFYKYSNDIKFCSPAESIKLIYNNFFNLHKEILEKYRTGEHKGIRWITSINNKKDIELVKTFIDKGIKIRHVKDLLSINFALSDNAFLFTIDKMDEDKMVTNILNSHDKLYINHYDIIFENLWKKGIDIYERIKSVEEGHYVNVEVIPNSKESLKFTRKLFNNATKEVLFILSSATSILRVENNMGFEFFDDLVTNNAIKVKLLIPFRLDLHHKINQIKSSYTKIELRTFHTNLNSLIGIAIIDRDKVLLVEIKDDLKKSKYLDSVGTTIFIEGESTALSYLSIFNSLWKQTDLIGELKIAYKKIQSHDKMQQEFINTAAHELRTPIQPILGLSKIVKDRVRDEEQKDLLDIVINNANRLKRLTEDILDVTKIEGNKLLLKKESVSIWELLHSIMKEFGHNMPSNNNNKNAKLNLYFKNIDLNTIIFVDKNRIAQVILNLFNNSVKFISKEGDRVEGGGNISIIVEKTKSNNKDNKNNDGISNEIIIRIKDNGQGIDPEIYPRLFTKFISRSFQGTGLGLYISKNIVEAHGGRIWAKNNEDGKGATFSFSLPLINDTNDGYHLDENS